METNRRVVQPDGHGGWEVRRPGAGRASSRHAKRADATDRAREILRRAGGGEVQVKGTDGQTRAWDTVATGKSPNR
jgi:hypothetical protein